MNANQVVIVGRLAAKPQLKSYTKSDGTPGTRCFFRVAVTRLGDLGKPRDERRTNFIPVVTWGSLAERCGQYLDKGTEVTVTGELLAESQRQDDGSFKEYIQLQANGVQFGRASQKNATTSVPGDMASQIAALQSRIDAITAGHTPAAGGMPAPAVNPFEEKDAATA